MSETDSRGFVDTMLREGQRVLDSMDEQIRGSDAADWAALAVGMLRAVHECPECGPGHYRRPFVRDGQEYAMCPDCGGLWLRKEPAP